MLKHILERLEMGMLEHEYLDHLKGITNPLTYAGHVETCGIAYSQNKQLKEYDKDGKLI